MGQIIYGAEISTYKTIAITLGQSKKKNQNGIESKYIVLSLKNKKSLLSDTRRVILFEDDVPGAHECLANFASQKADSHGGYPVDMVAFKANQQAMDEWGGLLEFPGGAVETYVFEKGPCYQNDVNGNRVLKDGKPVIKSKCEVFVQIDLIRPSDNGGMETIYIDGFSKERQGSRVEARFYKEPVVSTPQSSTDDVVIDADAEEVPAQRPF